MKKAKFGTDFQNNRANYWLYEKYSFDLHPEISKNPDELLWPEITDVAKTDCRNLHEPAMKDKYIDLIEQTFDFPQDEFSVEDNELNFHDIPLMELIKQYGTPLKITYLPKISQQINRAKRMFNVAMAKVDYKGSYNYCYCTKSSHFSFVLEEAMKNDVHLETSSAYDIHIINALYDGGIIDKDRYIICNGFKRPQYVENIAQLVNDGFVEHDPRAGQQGGARPVRGRLHQEVQGRHPHRLRGGTQVRVLHLAAGHPLQRHRRLLQGQAQEQQEVPAQDAAFLHQHRHQGHGLLLERAVEVHERLLRAESHLPRAGQPQHRRRVPHQELAQLRIRLRVPDRGDHRPDQEHLPAQRHRRNPTSSPSSGRSP